MSMGSIRLSAGHPPPPGVSELGPEYEKKVNMGRNEEAKHTYTHTHRMDGVELRFEFGAKRRPIEQHKKFRRYFSSYSPRIALSLWSLDAGICVIMSAQLPALCAL